MRYARTAYELSESQVTTPELVVSLFWQLARRRRKHLGSVLDVGAGDCRFAIGGSFERYTGVEIDRRRVAVAIPPPNGRIVLGCAFRHGEGGYDACIGNPPYARHHDIQSPWKEQTIARLERELGISLDKHCNLYLYFLCLGLLKTKANGLLGLVIPYEWVSRPSAKALREYIEAQRWNVAVYRFRMPIFDGVMTTASITFVDKARHDGHWAYYDITSEHRTVRRLGVTGAGRPALEYAERGKIWALRGLSPGSQRVFTLTEGERIRLGLTRRDVVPCVTTLRNVPSTLRVLSRASFRKHFVQAGQKCWLIRSFATKRSASLDAYLSAVPEKDRATYTCRNQSPWFNYLPHPVPRVMFASGFTDFGPKVLLNQVGAHAVGSVWGIHANSRLPLRRLQIHLLNTNFEAQVVAHAKTLKKVEVRQLNSVLNEFANRDNNT